MSQTDHKIVFTRLTSLESIRSEKRILRRKISRQERVIKIQVEEIRESFSLLSIAGRTLWRATSSISTIVAGMSYGLRFGKMLFPKGLPFFRHKRRNF